MSMKSLARKNARRGLAKAAIASRHGNGIITLGADNKLHVPVVRKLGRGFSQPYSW